ncbi:hypothetical protein GUJ93_ZPchr0006g42374 [Zizania palustris]|uniref:Uncharacterized protein n=1 Tax=Zizania palustris TaxID=103762 RepID=A0A8J5TC85_ZIZPA|nr:hypothetical protein GUJ93_ZPchr0006g42374 [Zizania palustris]
MQMAELDDAEGLPCLMIINTGRKLTLHMPKLLGYRMASGSGCAPNGVIVMLEDCSLIMRVFNSLTRQSMDLSSIAPWLIRRR